MFIGGWYNTIAYSVGASVIKVKPELIPRAPSLDRDLKTGGS
jgi:hypothetical protein